MPWPRCTVCNKPMVLGQMRMHAVCSSMLDAFPTHRPRCAAVKEKRYAGRLKSHRCVLSAGHKGMHQAAASAKQAPWL